MNGFLRHTRLLLLGATLALNASSLRAQPSASTPSPAPADRYEVVPEKLKNATQNVAIEDMIGKSIRRDLQFVDSTGKAVQLGDFFKSGKPVVLQMGYFKCPQICDVVSGALIETASKVTDLSIGKDYDFVYVSIDPSDRWTLAQEKKNNYVAAYDRAGSASGMHFLTGSQAHIQALADEIGFKFQKVEDTKDFAHPTMLTILTPDAKVSRYLFGVQYSNATLRMALVESGEGKLGSAVDQLVMLCYHWDSYAGKYTKDWMAIMRFGGAVSVLLLGSFIGLLFYREMRTRKHKQLLTA